VPLAVPRRASHDICHFPLTLAGLLAVSATEACPNITAKTSSQK
jgi:hypothetical protein